MRVLPAFLGAFSVPAVRIRETNKNLVSWWFHFFSAKNRQTMVNAPALMVVVGPTMVRLAPLPFWM